MDLMSIHLQQRKAHLGLLTNVTVTGGDGTMYHNVSATYNTNYPNHLTQVSQQLGNGTAVTDYKYDRYGNITQKTDRTEASLGDKTSDII